MRIGVDLGGTKIEGILLADDGSIVTRERVATPKDDYDGVVDAVVALVRRLEGRTGRLLRVGIGTPGAVSIRTGHMKNCNSTCLNGRPLHQDLCDRLDREVRIANDADCMALSEARDGAAAEYRSAFGVILGTGVGGGLCYEQRLLVGCNGIAGEWGHTTLPLTAYRRGSAETIEAPDPGDRRCYCGRYDCVETYLSGPGSNGATASAAAAFCKYQRWWHSPATAMTLP